MKKILFIQLVVLVSIVSKAQSFKDVYENMAQYDRFSNMLSLKDYQAQNPDHAICYFLLGNIFGDYMREIDPLLLFEPLDQNYSQLITYYGLAKFKLDDKQARQDREYFGPVEIISDKKKADLDDIVNEINKRIDAAKLYYANAVTVHDNYYRCINKYNECLFIFREIEASYPNYKDLYLLATPRLIKGIEDLEVNFDSALVFFDVYRESCANFPGLLNVNSYKLNPIVTYRLEGLIEADFTLPEVQLWDYKSWASNFLNLINTDIAGIRNGMHVNDNALDQEIEKLLKNEVYSDDFDSYKVDPKFQNLIGKYDHASLSNELIDYKKEKLNYALHTRNDVNNVNDSLQFFLINKLRFFRDLAHENVALNNQAEALKKSTSIDDIAKYIDFFEQKYNGMDGFIRWCEVEKYRNDQIFDKNLNNLSTFVYRDSHKNDYLDSTLVFKNKKMAFGTQYPGSESYLRDTMLTTATYHFQRNVYFQSGVYVNKDSILQPFFAKVVSNGKVDWLVYPTLKSNAKITDNQLSQVSITSDSVCYLVGHADLSLSADSQVSKTYISRYNWNGIQDGQTSFDSKLIPVYFWFDEINEQYLLVEKGDVWTDSVTVTHPMKVKLFTSTDTLIWENSFTLKGELTAVNFTNSNFLLTFNYTELAYDETNLNTEENLAAIAGIYITREGKVKYICDYRSKNKLLTQSCFKIANNAFNIFGKEQIGESNFEFFYVLVNDEGITEFNNRKEWSYKKIEF